LKKKTAQIFEALDSVHIDAVHKFTMSYTVYMGAPCSKDAYDKLQEAVTQIHRSIDKLRELDVDLERLKNKELGSETENRAITDRIDQHIIDLADFYQVA